MLVLAALADAVRDLDLMFLAVLLDARPVAVVVAHVAAPGADGEHAGELPDVGQCLAELGVAEAQKRDAHRDEQRDHEEADFDFTKRLYEVTLALLGTARDDPERQCGAIDVKSALQLEHGSRVTGQPLKWQLGRPQGVGCGGRQRCPHDAVDHRAPPRGRVRGQEEAEPGGVGKNRAAA